MGTKRILKVAMLALPFAQSFGKTTDLSLEELRQQCLELRANAQMKEFRVDFECRGSYTTWQSVNSKIELPTTSLLSVNAAGKAGTLVLENIDFDMESTNQNQSCQDYVKYRIETPVSVGQVVLNSCEQLEEAYINAQCTKKVMDYCKDNSATSSSSSSSSDEDAKEQNLCVKEKVETRSICSVY